MAPNTQLQRTVLRLRRRAISLCAYGALVLPAVSSPQDLSGERLSIQLLCTLRRTLGFGNGEISETSAEERLTVSYPPNRRAAVIELRDLGVEILGVITDNEISGIAEYDVDGMRVQQAVNFDRHTGSYRRASRVGNDVARIHVGECRQVTEPKL